MVFGPVLVDSHDFEGEGRSSARPPDRPRPVSQFAPFNSCLLQKSFVFIPSRRSENRGDQGWCRTHHRMVQFKITSG